MTFFYSLLRTEIYIQGVKNQSRVFYQFTVLVVTKKKILVNTSSQINKYTKCNPISTKPEFQNSVSEFRQKPDHGLGFPTNLNGLKNTVTPVELGRNVRGRHNTISKNGKIQKAIVERTTNMLSLVKKLIEAI